MEKLPAKQNNALTTQVWPTLQTALKVNDTRALIKITTTWDCKKIVNLVLDNPDVLPSLVLLRKKDEDELIDDICLLILNLLKSFNVGKNMDEEQVLETAYLLARCQDYGNLNVLDIMICFKDVKLGHYGKVYDRIDGPTILDWLRQYQDKRFEIIEAKRYQDHISIKGGDYPRTSETNTLKTALRTSQLKYLTQQSKKTKTQ